MSPNSDIPSDLQRFTVKAKELGVHVATLHRWRERPINPMPCLRIGHLWYVDRRSFYESRISRSGRTASSTPTRETADQRHPYRASRRSL